jgi:hypothetical protein
VGKGNYFFQSYFGFGCSRGKHPRQSPFNCFSMFVATVLFSLAVFAHAFFSSNLSARLPLYPSLPFRLGGAFQSRFVLGNLFVPRESSTLPLSAVEEQLNCFLSSRTGYRDKLLLMLQLLRPTKGGGGGGEPAPMPNAPQGKSDVIQRTR